MDVSYIRMTGKELEKIKGVSAMNAAQFAKELGISRSSLYVLFEQNAIPEDVETRLDGHPELSRYRKMVQVKESQSNQVAHTGPGMELIAKSLEMINQTIQLIQQSNDHIRRDSDFIKEDAKIYRSLVEQGMKEGVIMFKQKATK